MKMTQRQKQGYERLAKTSICGAGGNHIPGKISLRGKNDSYYLDCAKCNKVGDEGLIAVWYEKLPAWGLDAIATAMLHECFYRLRFSYMRAAEQDTARQKANKLRKRRRRAYGY